MIKYEPSKLLKKIAPERKIKKLLTDGFNLKKSALSFVEDIDFLSKRSVATVALKVIKSYKDRVKADSELKPDLLDDPALLIQRVQNEVVFQVKEGIKDSYSGEFYKWLPSDAEEPDPEHQTLYGKTFQIGDGEMPGDRYGCRCGMEILVKDSSLDI